MSIPSSPAAEHRPYPTEPRPVPSDQISVPRPPDRAAQLRSPHHTTVASSFQLNLVRVRADATLSGPVWDIIPHPGHTSASPAAVFGPHAVIAHVISGVNRWGEPATAAQNQASLSSLMAALRGLDYRPAVTMPPDREWLEPGAVVINADQDPLLALARHHGQATVLRWSSQGLLALDSRTGQPLADLGPVPVLAVAAATGCPMVRGRHDWCRTVGGWWTRGALAAARAFETHRQYLVGALGCDVCHGGPIGRASHSNATHWFQPTREGSWADPVPTAPLSATDLES